MSSNLQVTLQSAVPYSRPHTPDGRPVQQIGFVGLGSMGYCMAQNLANYRASHLNDHPPVLVWNRSSGKSQKLLEALGQEKVRVATDLAQIALECDIIITNLANDAAVKSVYEQFAATLTVCILCIFMHERR